MTKKTVWLRFYEELNDFLPPGKRKIVLPYSFTGGKTVKDAIESMGVPHVEVDLILVNGKSVDFSYKIKNDDRISVYPVFERLDISEVTHLREKPLRDVKFIADVHLGKLARYLRMCGFDTLYEKDYSDDEIIIISSLQKRIILTRDKRLLNNRKVTHGLRIRSGNPESQLKEVFDRLDLKNLAKPFTRCMGCNSLLVDVPKEKIFDKLPPRTREFYDTFRLCPQCNQIFWEGSHFKRMQEFINGFTGK